MAINLFCYPPPVWSFSVELSDAIFILSSGLECWCYALRLSKQMHQADCSISLQVTSHCLYGKKVFCFEWYLSNTSKASVPLLYFFYYHLFFSIRFGSLIKRIIESTKWTFQKHDRKRQCFIILINLFFFNDSLYSYLASGPQKRPWMGWCEFSSINYTSQLSQSEAKCLWQPAERTLSNPVKILWHSTAGCLNNNLTGQLSLLFSGD